MMEEKILSELVRFSANVQSFIKNLSSINYVWAKSRPQTNWFDDDGTNMSRCSMAQGTIQRMKGVSPCHDALNSKQQSPKGTHFKYIPITTPRQ